MPSHSSKPPRIALGIDVGGTGIKGALVDTRRGKLTVKRHRIPTPRPVTPAAVAQTVAEIARHFAWEGPLGCTVPARVRQGVLETASNIDPSWIGTDAQVLFGEATGSPTTVLNDADAAGIAEVRFGAGKDQEGVVLVLTFGTGIGSALFIDGRLVPNTELGHLRLDGATLEDRASNAARKKEKLGWEQWAERVQSALAHLEFILAPDLIVMGGGVSRRDRWKKFSHLLRTHARLVPARHENDAGLIGAAWAAYRATRD
jgi:polyphosphate glucokinase